SEVGPRAGDARTLDGGRRHGRDYGLEGTGHADDDVVDGSDDAVAVLDRADDDRRGATGEVARSLVFDFTDELAADVGEESGLALFGAAGDVDRPQPQLVRFVDAADRFLVLGDRQVFGSV